MATNPNSNAKFFVEKDDRILYVDPISWISPNDNNNNDGDKSSDDDSYDSNADPKHNNDATILTTPTKKIASSSTSSTKKTRRTKTFPAEWAESWEVEERPRSNGTKTDKYYHHKTEGITCRSMKAVAKYEKDGKLPERKRKHDGKGKEIINAEEEVDDNIAKKTKEEAESMRIRVEEFLAESHNNLLHWFDP